MARAGAMYGVPQARPRWPAVAGPFERGVRLHYGSASSGAALCPSGSSSKKTNTVGAFAPCHLGCWTTHFCTNSVTVCRADSRCSLIMSGAVDFVASVAVIDLCSEAIASLPVRGDQMPNDKDSSLVVFIATGSEGRTAGAMTMSVLPVLRKVQSFARGM